MLTYSSVLGAASTPSISHPNGCSVNASSVLAPADVEMWGLVLLDSCLLLVSWILQPSDVVAAKALGDPVDLNVGSNCARHGDREAMMGSLCCVFGPGCRIVGVGRSEAGEQGAYVWFSGISAVFGLSGRFMVHSSGRGSS